LLDAHWHMLWLHTVRNTKYISIWKPIILLGTSCIFMCIY
jgi:hypothetical protein